MGGGEFKPKKSSVEGGEGMSMAIFWIFTIIFCQRPFVFIMYNITFTINIIIHFHILYNIRKCINRF